MNKLMELRGAGKLGHRLLIVLVCLVVLVPLYWLVVLSVTPQTLVAGTRSPAMWPRQFTFESYQQFLNPELVPRRGSPIHLFRRAFINSSLVAVVSTAIGVFIAALTAYALARLRFKINRLVFVLILASQLVAPITLAIPLFSVFRQLGILDTYTPLVLVYMRLTLAWSALILVNYFRMLPVEIEESGRIDGCSRLGTLFRIILPMSAPGIVSVATVTFLFSWGEFLFALLLTRSAASRTLPVIATLFVGEMHVQYRVIATVIILTIAPPVLFALVFNRYIVQGLTSGSVKE